jgi:hypothetical protein
VNLKNSILRQLGEVWKVPVVVGDFVVGEDQREPLKAGRALQASGRDF